jgi:YHS domain-containing protein
MPVQSDQLARQAANAAKPLSICGELAADVSMLPVLVGLGIRHFSLAPGAVSEVRTALGQLDEWECGRLAQQCLAADTAQEVRTLLGRLPAHPNEPRSIRDGQAVDPVCGMVVSTDQTPYLAHQEGVAYYFCSACCLRHFMTSQRRSA